jgi:hypothetical protein
MVLALAHTIVGVMAPVSVGQWRCRSHDKEAEERRAMVPMKVML